MITQIQSIIPVMQSQSVATFFFETQNLGDDLQALAVSTFLPRVDALVNRDQLDMARLPKRHCVVLNSWFQLPRKAGPFWGRYHAYYKPDDSIDPLFFGFCVGSDEMLNNDWIGYLRAHAPVGCRDHKSVDLLSRLGIQAYWSGCATALFGSQFEQIPTSARSGIVIADIPPEIEAEWIPEHLRRRAIRISNFCPPGIRQDPLQRMHYMARICDLLRSSELVITRRLHVALPCAGFNTPVVVLRKVNASSTRRFSGFDDFLPGIEINRSNELQRSNVNWDCREPSILPEALASQRDRLIREIRARMGSAHTGHSTQVSKTVHLKLPNPGLGAEPGEVAIALNGRMLSRPFTFWTDQAVEVTLDLFAQAERFNFPLMLRGRKRDHWVQVDTLGHAMTRADAATQA